MKSLRNGERVGSVGIVLGLFAVLCLLVGLAFFVVDARQTARDAVQAERDLRAVILSRCLQRTTYDQRFVTAAEGDAQFYADLLAEADRLDQMDLPADSRASLERQREIIQRALERKLAIVEQGVIGSCEQYEDPRDAT